MKKTISKNCSIQEAKELLGANHFFGPEEWEKFFGKKFQLAKLPKIPWSQFDIRISQEYGIKQEHFLFLGVDKLSGEPLNIDTWIELYHGNDHPKFASDWSDDWATDIRNETCRSRWYSMPIGYVINTVNQTYERGQYLLPPGYEIPSMIERVSANILYYHLNGEYLDPGERGARTNALSPSDDYGRRRHVFVSGNKNAGLSYGFMEPMSTVGIAASVQVL